MVGNDELSWWRKPWARICGLNPPFCLLESEITAAVALRLETSLARGEAARKVAGLGAGSCKAVSVGLRLGP